MKPTLKQLKNRPALWVLTCEKFVALPRITMPDGTMWALESGDIPILEGAGWHQWAIDNYEFLEWL